MHRNPLLLIIGLFFPFFLEAAMLEENLKTHVNALAGEIGERNYQHYGQLAKASRYVQAQFKSLNYKVELQTYSIDNLNFENIIAVKKGNSDSTLIVGAHYDTAYGTPGADDNASGVAGLLELARLVSQEKFKTTIKFIAFVNEELPFFKTDLMGSAVYVRQARARKENIQGMICLEMLGYFTDRYHSQSYPPMLKYFYPDRGNFIGLVGNFKSRKLLRQTEEGFKQLGKIEAYTSMAPRFLPGIDFSDHVSFWDAGYPAIMITDTAFYRNPNYHERTDTPATINYKKMEEIVLGLQLALQKLAS